MSDLTRESSLDGAGEIGYARQTVIPVLPENATIEEREVHWMKYVYQGDHVPQFTFRAVLVGAVIGMFMSISNLYTTVKLGWAFGVAITACVISYVVWNALRGLTGGKLTQMSILENNCMQSTASAAGYSTGGTMGTAVGAMLLITGHNIAWQYVLPFTFFTAALGCFLAIPMKRQMINIEQLKFPSGIAAAETLRSLYSHGAEAMRKAYALLLSMLAGGIVGFLRVGEGTLGFIDKFHEFTRGFLRIPELVNFPTSLIGVQRGTVNGFGFEPSVLLIGAGLIVGMRVAMSMFVGSVVLYFVFIPWMMSYDAAHLEAAKAAGTIYKTSFNLAPDGSFNPMRWALWTGTAIMVFSSLTSVALQWKTVIRAFRLGGSGAAHGSVADAALLKRASDIEVPMSWFIAGMIPITIGMIWVNYIAFQMEWYLGLIAVALSFVLALVCSRAVGETDTGPIGAMGKVTQLLYALLAHGNITINLMSAGTTACAAGSSADLLTDLKSGYLLGANPRKQFLAQFVGVFFGTLAIVPAWYLMFPRPEILEAYNPPATNMWRAVAEVLVKGIQEVPITAQIGLLIGALIGVALPVISKLAPKFDRFMPSAMGLGLAWVMPFQNSLSFAIGALIALSWTKIDRKSAEGYAVPIASGLIAGESLIAAFVAILVALPEALPKLIDALTGKS